MPPRLFPVCLAVAFSATLLAACDSGDGTSTQAQAYTGALVSINASGVRGTFEMQVNRDRTVTVALDLTGLYADTVHAQHLHALERCPSSDEDTNGDGFIDIREAEPVIGPILLRLDSDLTSPDSGAFPLPDSDGTLAYRATAPLDSLPGALAGARAQLEERSIVILGTDPATPLPKTVGSAFGLPPYATLPVACAPIDLADPTE